MLFVSFLGQHGFALALGIWGNPLIYRVYFTHRPVFQSIYARFEALQRIKIGVLFASFFVSFEMFFSCPF